MCVSSIGCDLGHINLYDNLYHDSVLTQEVEEQTNDFLGVCLVALNPMPVQQQTNGSDCGIFAIAFSKYENSLSIMSKQWQVYFVPFILSTLTMHTV